MGELGTDSCAGNPNVKALVYVAALAPAQGETLQQLIARKPGSLLGPDVLDVFPYTGLDGQPVLEATVKPSAFRPILAGDLPA